MRQHAAAILITLGPKLVIHQSVAMVTTSFTHFGLPAGIIPNGTPALSLPSLSCHVCVRACMRECVRECARACVCEWERERGSDCVCVSGCVASWFPVLASSYRGSILCCSLPIIQVLHALICWESVSVCLLLVLDADVMQSFCVSLQLFVHVVYSSVKTNDGQAAKSFDITLVRENAEATRPS